MKTTAYAIVNSKGEFSVNIDQYRIYESREYAEDALIFLDEPNKYQVVTIEIESPFSIEE